MNLAIAVIIGGTFIVLLYVLGIAVELVCAVLDKQAQRHGRRNRVIVFGDNTPLRGAYTPPSHCDVQKAHDSFVKQNP